MDAVLVVVGPDGVAGVAVVVVVEVVVDVVKITLPPTFAKANMKTFGASACMHIVV